MSFASKVISHRFSMAVVSLFAATTSFAASIPLSQIPVVGGAAGEVYDMASQKNAVFVFEGLRLDCVYCNQNASTVDQFATSFASEPRVQVLDLCIDTQVSKCLEWKSLHNPNHKVVHDGSRKIFNALKTQNAVPQAFVVNCRGEMVANFVGAWGSQGTASLRQAVQKALETTCDTSVAE